MSSEVLHDFVAGEDGIRRCTMCRQTQDRKGERFPNRSVCSPSTRRLPRLEAELTDILQTPTKGAPDELADRPERPEPVSG
jgi:hypothetical protein